MTPTSSLLAAFISPGLFYGGAAVVAAPILIHLLARRRFKRIRWAAMDFLIDAERRNRRRLRMEEWILLALRCLAVVLIAAMIARPFFKPAGAAAWWGGSQRTERIFVLDDSLSMAYETSEGPVFKRARLAVRRLIDSIRRQSPDDTVTIIRMSEPTAPVESGAYLDDTQTDDLLARLDALSATQRSIELAAVVEGVAEVLERNPEITNAVIYIVSDFQRNDWAPADPSRGRKPARTSADDQPGGSGIFAPLKAWAADDRGLRLLLINVGEEEAANVAVTELGLPGGRLVAGTSGTLRAEVANYTNRPIRNLELRLTVGDLPQPPRTLRELGPRQRASVDLEAEFVRAGFEAVRVELPPDALPADDVRHVAAEVAGAIRVLIVNGEPSADGFNDEVTFLTTALRPEGEVFSGNELVVVDEAELEDTNLSGFHAVAIANVYRLSEPVIETLERFVRRGGGVIFFLGDQVDADLYNAALYREGEGLLPAKLTEVIRAAGTAHLVVTDRLHPAVRGLSGQGDPLGVGRIAFFKYFGCVPFDVTTTGETDKVGDTEDSGYAGAEIPSRTLNAGARIPSRTPAANAGARIPSRTPAARVIARFDDLDGHPAIVERPFGKGRVILVTTSADKEWHQWPDHPTFLPLMMELVRHIARGGDMGSRRWVGEPIELPLDPALFEPDALVRTPAYPNENETGLTAAPAGEGEGLALKWDHTDAAGIYQFLLRRRGDADASQGGEVLRLVAVNVDPRESDLAMVEEDELRRTIGEVPFEYIRGIDNLSEAAGETRTELWRVCLLAVVAVLMIEQFLAWRWGRRR